MPDRLRAGPAVDGEHQDAGLRAEAARRVELKVAPGLTDATTSAIGSSWGLRRLTDFAGRSSSRDCLSKAGKEPSTSPALRYRSDG